MTNSSRGDYAQNFVASGVPDRIIHRLESVEVDKMHAHVPALTFCSRDGLTYPFLKVCAIREASHSIEVRFSCEKRFVANAFER